MDWAYFVEQGQAHLDRGGVLMLVIAGLSVWMWSLVGLKIHSLITSRQHERSLHDWLCTACAPDFVPAPWQIRLLRAAQECLPLRKTLRRKYMQAQADQVAAGFTRHTGTILMLAGAAPLLGLLGTVTGMIETFDVITLHGTGNAKGLAGGISVALITTQAGLVAAVPGLVLGHFLRRRAFRACDRVDRFTHGLLLEADKGGLDKLDARLKEANCEVAS